MNDGLLGEVTSVIDGNTFLVRVVKQAQKSGIVYREKEKIRISGLEVPPLSEFAGKHAKEKLERRLFGCMVALEVLERKPDFILCKVLYAERVYQKSYA